MKKNKIKISIIPILESDKLLSFKLRSNVNISGFQFNMSGFSSNHFYQFQDIGTLKAEAHPPIFTEKQYKNILKRLDNLEKGDTNE